jgi:hypothetical protein
MIPGNNFTFHRPPNPNLHGNHNQYPLFMNQNQNMMMNKNIINNNTGMMGNQFGYPQNQFGQPNLIHGSQMNQGIIPMNVGQGNQMNQLNNQQIQQNMNNNPSLNIEPFNKSNSQPVIVDERKNSSTSLTQNSQSGAPSNDPTNILNIITALSQIQKRAGNANLSQNLKLLKDIAPTIQGSNSVSDKSTDPRKRKK